MELETGGTRSHSVVNSLWNCRKTVYVMMLMMMMIMIIIIII